MSDASDAEDIRSKNLNRIQINPSSNQVCEKNLFSSYLIQLWNDLSAKAFNCCFSSDAYHYKMDRTALQIIDVVDNQVVFNRENLQRVLNKCGNRAVTCYSRCSVKNWNFPSHLSLFPILFCFILSARFK